MKFRISDSKQVELDVVHFWEYPRGEDGLCVLCHGDPCADGGDDTLIAEWWRNNPHASTCPICEGRPSQEIKMIPCTCKVTDIDDHGHIRVVFGYAWFNKDLPETVEFHGRKFHKGEHDFIRCDEVGKVYEAMTYYA